MKQSMQSSDLLLSRFNFKVVLDLDQVEQFQSIRVKGHSIGKVTQRVCFFFFVRDFYLPNEAHWAKVDAPEIERRATFPLDS